MYRFKSQRENEGQTFVHLIHATNDLAGDQVVFGAPTYLGPHADRHVEVYPEAIVVFPPGPPTEDKHTFRLVYPGDDTISVIPLTERAANLMAEAATRINHVEYRYTEGI